MYYISYVHKLDRSEMIETRVPYWRWYCYKTGEIHAKDNDIEDLITRMLKDLGGSDLLVKAFIKKVYAKTVNSFDSVEIEFSDIEGLGGHPITIKFGVIKSFYKDKYYDDKDYIRDNHPMWADLRKEIITNE